MSDAKINMVARFTQRIEKETTDSWKYKQWEEQQKKNPAAVALGSLTSKKKARTSRENGKKGGRPKRVPPQMKSPTSPT